MSVRMRHTSSHTRNRRSHHAVAEPRLSTCVKCGSLHLRHHACSVCGTYKGKEVIDVTSKIIKNAEKKKTKREAKKGEPEKTPKKEKKEKVEKAEKVEKIEKTEKKEKKEKKEKGSVKK